jgi:hypothetical protein
VVTLLVAQQLGRVTLEFLILSRSFKIACTFCLLLFPMFLTALNPTIGILLPSFNTA